MLESFFAFNQNAVSNFLYMLTSNMWFILLIIGTIGSIVLLLKEEIDIAIKDEHPVL